MHPYDDQTLDLFHAVLYHRPSEQVLDEVDEFRTDTKQFIDALYRFLPEDSRERSLAYTKLQECFRWALNAKLVPEREV